MCKRLFGGKTFAIVVIGVVLGALATASAGGDGSQTATARRTVWNDRVAHRRHVPRRAAVNSRHYGYNGPSALPPGVMVMPGYVFVPGRGILGAACDLPTSTCPNTERDVQ
jgi:hypothetical protein